MNILSIFVNIRREFLIDTHITMEYDDMSCIIEENEQEAHCFNPISGINHLIYRDNGDDEDCPWVPTRKKLIRGQVLTSSSGQAFVSHFNKIYFEIKKKEDLCGCEDTYSTNYDDVMIRKINAYCSPIADEVVPHPSSINLEVHANTKVNIFCTYLVMHDQGFI